MINWSRVNELKNDIGPDDINDIVELFLSEVEEVIEKLSGNDGGDSLEQHMHFLKGSALNLGFDGLGQLCSDAEKQAALGQDQAVSIPEIISNFQQSKAEFLAGL